MPRTKGDINDIIGEVDELPALPTVIAQITSMTNNPQTNAADVGKIISNDPTLSSKILKLINSAYYGFPRKISSVTKAIVLLGFNKVKNIALGASMVDMFKGTGSINQFDFYRFWEHSVASAIAAECIAKALQPAAVDDAFVGGLLHDVGKVVIVNHVRDGLAAFEHAEKERVVFNDAAKTVLGFDSAKAGSLLTEHWNFPEVLVRTIRYWPYPNRTRQMREAIGCVHLGNVFASALGMGSPGDYAMPTIDHELWEEFKLDEVKVEKLLDETYKGFKKRFRFP